MKKFCTVRNGRNVKTDRITSIFPNIHKITILERTSATGRASVNAIGEIVDDENEGVVVVELRIVRNLVVDIFELVDDIKYQSIKLIFNGNNWLSFSIKNFRENKSRRCIEIVNGTEIKQLSIV